MTNRLTVASEQHLLKALLEHVSRMGAHLSQSIVALEHDNIAGVRGVGLLQAVVLQGVTGSAVEAAARANGFLVNAVAPDAIRLAPPLVITQVEIDEFVQALPQILKEATS